MSTSPETAASVEHDIQHLGRHWGWLLALGIGTALLGMFAIGWSCVATLTVAATWLFGFLLLASGISEVVNVFWSGRWSGMLLHLIVGILYIFVGFLIIDQPLEAALSITLLIAIFLIFSGIVRMVFAISERFPGSGWVLLNGGVTFLLGVMIYKQWPASGLWVIGLFIGVDLIFNGLAWIMLAIGVRRAQTAA